MWGETCDDKNRIEKTRRYVGVAPTNQKIRKRRLSLYDNVMNRLHTTPIKKRLDMQISTDVDGEVDKGINF